MAQEIHPWVARLKLVKKPDVLLGMPPETVGPSDLPKEDEALQGLDCSFGMASDSVRPVHTQTLYYNWLVVSNMFYFPFNIWDNPSY